MRAVLIGIGGAVAGASIGIGLAIVGVWAVRTFGSDPSSWADLGVAAVALVVATPVLTVIGTLIALRVGTGRAIARPIAMTAAMATVVGAVGALIGSGVTRFSLALVGAALGLAAASAFDRRPVEP
jgi:hypothetical protein